MYFDSTAYADPTYTISPANCLLLNTDDVLARDAGVVSVYAQDVNNNQIVDAGVDAIEVHPLVVAVAVWLQQVADQGLQR